MTTEREQDYVYNLAVAVRALAPEAYDSHLFALEVRSLPHRLPLPRLRLWRREGGGAANSMKIHVSLGTHQNPQSLQAQLRELDRTTADGPES
jgi:hypothetical protein